VIDILVVSLRFGGSFLNPVTKSLVELIGKVKKGYTNTHVNILLY